jgi:type II secretory pathway pseudopilin PulG
MRIMGFSLIRDLQELFLGWALRAAFSLHSLPGMSSHEETRTSRQLAAFSIIELLVVVAIIAIMMVFVAPSISSLFGAQGVAKATADGAGILEMARMEAMARKTYVYVGFAGLTNSLGNLELRIGAVASLDGTSETSEANLRAISRLVKIDRVALAGSGDLPGLDVPTGVTPDSFVNRFPSFAEQFPSSSGFRVGEQDFTSMPVMIISPHGELLETSNAIEPLPFAVVGSRPGRGREPEANPSNWAALVYHGGTGNVQTLRP